MIVLLVWGLGFAILIGVFAYLYYNDGISIFDVNDLIFNFSGLSEMDSALMSGLSAAIMIVQQLILIGNFTLKNQFIELMRVFASLNLPQQVQGRIYFLITIILSWTISQFGVIATGFSTDSIDLKTKVLVIIAILSFSIIQTSQLIGFLILYSEVCNQLNNWIINMIQGIESKQKYEWEIIEECSKLLKVGLKKSNSIFSSFLF